VTSGCWPWGFDCSGPTVGSPVSPGAVGAELVWPLPVLHIEFCRGVRRSDGETCGLPCSSRMIPDVPKSLDGM